MNVEDDDAQALSTELTQKFVEKAFEARNAIARQHGPQIGDSIALQLVLGFSTNIILSVVCSARGDDSKFEEFHGEINTAIAKFITELVASKIGEAGGVLMIDVKEKRRQREMEASDGAVQLNPPDA